MKKPPNITHRTNGITIREAFLAVAKDCNRPPTITELSNITGFSRNTVSKHINELSFEKSVKKMRILSEDVLLSIAKTAIDGNPTSQKLFTEIVEGWNGPPEKVEIKQPFQIMITTTGGKNDE